MLWIWLHFRNIKLDKQQKHIIFFLKNLICLLFYKYGKLYTIVLFNWSFPKFYFVYLFSAALYKLQSERYKLLFHFFIMLWQDTVTWKGVPFGSYDNEDLTLSITTISLMTLITICNRMISWFNSSVLLMINLQIYKHYN